MRRRILAAALAALCVTRAAAAAESAPEPVRFEIRSFSLEGNTLLAPAALERILAPHRGPDKDFADIQRALEGLEAAYREIGYGVVQITLPEQNISQGDIRFVIIEPRLGKVTVEGNKHFGEANIRASVPALREGEPPNSHAIARALAIANENPSKNTQVLLRSTEAEDRVDARIRVADDKFWKVGLTLDNTGTNSTGDWRVGASYQHGNLFDRDHVLTAQFITSPGHWGDVKIYGVGYRVPFYGLGTSLDVFGGYSDVNSGTLQNLFAVSGSGTIFGARYNQQLARIGEYEHKIVYGLDYRAYQNQVDQIGASEGSSVPDITVHPISAYYAGQWRTSASELSFYLYAAQNVFANGNDASDSAFKASRADAKAAYRLYRYNLNYAQVLPRDFIARFALFGQETRDALVAGEQFGLGGADNVRGFEEREISNDRGRRMTLELSSPDLGALLEQSRVRARAVAFYDWGTLRRRHAQPGDVDTETIASAGVGLRFTASNTYSVRIDAAQVLQAGGSQQRGDWKVHALFSTVF